MWQNTVQLLLSATLVICTCIGNKLPRNHVNDDTVLNISQKIDDNNIASMRRQHILYEFKSLAKLANETVEQFGQAFLQKWLAKQEEFCKRGFDENRFPSACRKTCLDRDRGAMRLLIVIPIRNRQKHAERLMQILVPLLLKQGLCFLVVLAEQTAGKPFNKGLLMNAGVLESLDIFPFHCIIFHDVDLIPISPYTNYSCPVYPKHMSVHIDKFDFKLPYLRLIGGVLALPTEHFIRVNGFSNLFWGWGAEDDDIYERISFIGLPLTRLPASSGYYKMLRHGASEVLDSWRRNTLLLLSIKRYRIDGLNTLIYRLVEKKLQSARYLKPQTVACLTLKLLIQPSTQPPRGVC